MDRRVLAITVSYSAKDRDTAWRRNAREAHACTGQVQNPFVLSDKIGIAVVIGRKWIAGPKPGDHPRPGAEGIKSGASDMKLI